MAIPKIVGIEQEYAITVEGQKDFNPIWASFLVVNSYRQLSTISWDYNYEDPLKDARGFKRDGENIVVSQEDNRAINNVLQNGARFYVDHAHPEFSTPECSNVLDVVAADKAGEIILDISRRQANTKLEAGQAIQIYKNNSDHKGNSYGCHENFLMDADAYERIFKKHQGGAPEVIRHLIPFFVSRQVFSGAGKVGSENGASPVDYQISQRADFFETLIDGKTMCNRPIVNTRDEPHADRKRFRRMHCIVGDANMSEYCTYLKVGTAQIILRMMEDEFIRQDLSLEHPIRDIKAVSHNTELDYKIPLKNGKRYTAIELQRVFLELAHKYFSAPDREKDPFTDDILFQWEDTLNKLEEDPEQLRDRIDWVIKRWLLRRKMAQKNLEYKSAVIRMMDIQYHDIRRDKGLYYVLEKAGRIKRVLPDDELIRYYVESPPVDTRAYFRGKCLEKFGKNICGINWDHLIFSGEQKNKMVFLSDPFKGTKELVGDLLERSETHQDLLRELQA
jgi:Pup amidohydrolase